VDDARRTQLRGWVISALLGALAAACGAKTPAPAPESSGSNTTVDAPANPPPGRTTSTEPARTAEKSAPPESAADVNAYDKAFVRELTRVTRTREVPPAQGGDAPSGAGPHRIAVLKKVGHQESYVIATVGLGRVAHGVKPGARVELLAYASGYSAGIAKVLSALGELMHGRGADAPAWKEYDTVQLPQAQLGLEYFDLRPAGEVDIAPGERVVLLKVMPMSADEFEKAQANPSGEWTDPNADARAAQRWQRLLENGP
jgi:hypothetical protein